MIYNKKFLQFLSSICLYLITTDWFSYNFSIIYNTYCWLYNEIHNFRNIDIGKIVQNITNYYSAINKSHIIFTTNDAGQKTENKLICHTKLINQSNEIQ